MHIANNERSDAGTQRRSDFCVFEYLKGLWALLNYIYYILYYNIIYNIYNYVRDFRYIADCKCSCVAACLRHSVGRSIVVSMQAMSEHTVISWIKIFVESDCSNLGGGANIWAEMRRNTRKRESYDDGLPKEKTANLCKMFSIK